MKQEKSSPVPTKGPGYRALTAKRLSKAYPKTIAKLAKQ